MNIENDFEMDLGPELINERFNHACGTFQWNDKTVVIAVGGRSEISKNYPNSNNGLVEGKYYLQGHPNQTDDYFVQSKSTKI